MDRRDALRSLAATLAAPRFFDWGSGPLVEALRPLLEAQSASAAPAPPYAFQFFTPPQVALVDELSELVIPATDTPGARAAKVVEFMDLLLAEWANDNDRLIFTRGMADVEARAQAAGGTSFVALPMDARIAICRTLDDELTALRTANAAWQKSGRTLPRPRDHRSLFWHHVRQHTVSGYYTSEVGWTLERKNRIMPMTFDPRRPVEGR